MFKVYKYSVSGSSNDVLPPLSPSPHYRAVYGRQIMLETKHGFHLAKYKKIGMKKIFSILQ